MATMATSASRPQSVLNTPPTTLSVLPPINTEAPGKTQSGQRPTSYAKDRLSMYSNVSVASQNCSRPGSHVFPIFHSSLPYALVRDFAYPPTHPLHYGPLPPRASGVSTPASEHRRLSDPPASWDASRGQWSSGLWGTDPSPGNQQLPAMSFGDGPPYSEDEDLHSPVFSASRHRKNKSTGTHLNARRTRSPGRSHRSVDFSGQFDRGTLISMNADGSETYYVDEDEDAADDGPGGEYVTYPASESRYSHMGGESYSNEHNQKHDAGFESEDDYSGDRYSGEFQFAVGCPDEEMHGKAVALFDFTREHENELPLTEGQVIFVSYRHGQGWLVAEDPKTGESGLVPEEFVRLLRDIEGGLTSLSEDPNLDTEEDNTYLSPDSTDSEQALTPTQNDQLPLSSDRGSIPVTNGTTRAQSPVVVPTGGGEATSNSSHLMRNGHEIDSAPPIAQEISEKRKSKRESRIGITTKT
ncbi:adaptor protein NBP2 [Aspergillus clavatus NRRL 1]|uniref:SH3 domain protein n=1 Tax=Aspergillus clavatus (strain ATCC 1007 / CBS 513.65 / DSM 816 / NCTC 3887 / NRRL 1 / QM 1276 / 107) TaxID=344612 RepID=A1CEU2_ASPCL|nr:SH3 domain protein [Aspergillus clavatus NRRL 1]EAW11391.1 SH3 domain protein [Aspergillus clavatus NRRL 1]